MHTVGVVITRFVDPHQPGFVECVLTDAWGREWTFVEKVPVVSAAALDEHSLPPARRHRLRGRPPVAQRRRTGIGHRRHRAAVGR